MKTTRFLICTTVLSALPVIALAHGDPKHESADPSAMSKQSGWTSGDTARALTKLHQVNLEEISAGKLAQQNGSMDNVKDLGETLVDDHQDIDDDVKDLANDRHVKLNDTLPSNSEAAKSLEMLRNLQGAAFDQKFASMMVQGHDKAIAMVRSWRASTDDAKLRSLLEDTLPKLEEHREMASKITQNM